MQLRYDPQADALYIQVTDGAVVRTVSFDDTRAADFSEDGTLRGLEFLWASDGIDLNGLPGDTQAMMARILAETDLPTQPLVTFAPGCMPQVVTCNHATAHLRATWMVYGAP